MYYLYSEETSEVYQKSETEPTEGLYCKFDQDIDLVLYRLIVGMVDENKNLTYPQIKARPAEELARQIKEQQAENDVFGQTIASLSLQNMQLNATLDTMSKSLAQAQLDIMSLKGGVS